jgi:hypothetical protein
VGRQVALLPGPTKSAFEFLLLPFPTGRPPLSSVGQVQRDHDRSSWLWLHASAWPLLGLFQPLRLPAHAACAPSLVWLPPFGVPLPFVSALSRTQVRRFIVELRRPRLCRRSMFCRCLNLLDGQVPRQLGIFSKSAVRADWSPKNDSWLDHRRGDNLGIVGFLCKTPLELTRLDAPGVRSRFHGRRRDGQIEEAHRGLVGLEFPRHQYRALSTRNFLALC